MVEPIGQTTLDDDDAARKFGRALESILIGGIRLGFRYLRTVWVIVFAPKSAVDDLKDESSAVVYVRPFTFLVLSSLFGSAAVHSSGGALDVAVPSATIFDLLESAVEVSSVTDVLRRAFPTTIATILGALLLARLVFKNTMGLDGVSVRVLCLCAGAQLAVMVVRVAVLTGLAWYGELSGQFILGSLDTHLVVAGTLSVGMWVMAALAGIPVVRRCLMDQREQPSRRGWRTVLAIATSTLMFCCVLAGSDATTFERIRSIDAEIADAPRLQQANDLVILAGKAQSDSGEFELTILVRNGGTEQLYLDLGDSLVGFLSTQAGVFRVEESNVETFATGEPVVALDEGQSAWVVMRGRVAASHCQLLKKLEYKETTNRPTDGELLTVLKSLSPSIRDARPQQTIDIAIEIPGASFASGPNQATYLFTGSGTIRVD